MESFFKVSAEKVEKFIDNFQQSVDLTRDILWAETRRQGLSPLSGHVSFKVTTADGGIDAIVKLDTVKEKGLIFPGESYYQIKFGHSFNPTKDTDLKKELYTKAGKFRPKLKNLEKSKGTYVLIWFGGYVGDQYEATKKKIKKHFKDESCPNVNVEVLDLTQIAQYCSMHIAVQATYFNPLINNVLTLNKWRGRFENIDDPEAEKNERLTKSKNPLLGFRTRYDEWTEVIRLAITSNTPIQVIYTQADNQDVTKSNKEMAQRLIYEALNHDGYLQNTICVDAENLKPPVSSFIENTNMPMIVLVDECSEKDHHILLNTLGQRDVYFLVLSNDNAPIEDSRFSNLDLSGRLDSTLIKEMRKQKPEVAVPARIDDKDYSIPDQVKPTLPSTLKRSYVYITSKYGYDFLNSSVRILRFLALFSKVGSEINVTPELKHIAEKLGYESEADWLRFAEFIHVLRNEKLIGGNYYISISNTKGRHYLILEWWEIYGIAVDFQKYLRSIFMFSPDLAERLLDSVPYITTSDNGKRVARSMLNKQGIFASGELVRDKFGSQLFSKLTEADPAAALKCLQGILSRWSKEEIKEFVDGRREVVWSLEKIVIWKDLFNDGARLILALAEEENEHWSNNATGVFSGLFSMGYGDVAPTEASPSDRLPVLKDNLSSDSQDIRTIVLNACNTALETNFISRTAGAENQGLRKKAQLWSPKTYGEIFDGYRGIWQLLESSLSYLQEQDKEKAIEVLLQRARGLISIQNLAPMALKTLENLASSNPKAKRQLLETVIQIINYDGKDLQPDSLTRLEKLRSDLTGDEYALLMERYVAMDLIEDHFNPTGQENSEVQEKIRDLAKTSLADTKSLQEELVWLTTNKAENGFQFGYELGKEDKENKLLALLVKAQRATKENANLFFVGGYFRALKEKQLDVWEDELDGLAKDTVSQKWLPELSWRSGMTDRAALRILELAYKNIITSEQFGYFTTGSSIEPLSNNVVIKMLEYLLKDGKYRSIITALDLSHFYFIMKNKAKLPAGIIKQLLNHKSLYTPDSGTHGQMDDYYWSLIAKSFIAEYPNETDELASNILEHMDEPGTILESRHSETRDVLNEIVRQNPKKIWPKVAKQIQPPIDRRVLDTTQWLRGDISIQNKNSGGALVLFPPDDIWNWVDEDVKKRAWYLATFVPPEIFRSTEQVCFARELLIRYGDRKDVRNNLISNFTSEGWSGNASDHYKAKRKYLQKFREDETDKNVLLWLDEYIDVLAQYIDREVLYEEHRGY